MGDTPPQGSLGPWTPRPVLSSTTATIPAATRCCGRSNRRPSPACPTRAGARAPKAPGAETWRRMIGRFVSTGRIILPDVMQKGIDGAPRTYDILKQKGAAAGFARIDNSPGLGQPRGIVEDGAGILPEGAVSQPHVSRRDGGTDRPTRGGRGPASDGSPGAESGRVTPSQSDPAGAGNPAPTRNPSATSPGPRSPCRTAPRRGRPTCSTTSTPTRLPTR